MSKCLTLANLMLLLLAISGCGTLAATGGHHGSNEYGFDNSSQAPSDASISATIRRQLINNADINASHISVATQHGVVTLHGMVRDGATRDRIIALCRQTAGVAQVNSRLTITQD